MPRSSSGDLLGSKRNVAVLAASVFGIGLAEELWQAFLPKYLVALGAGGAAIGVFASTRDLLDGLYQYPGGWFADRFGRKATLLLFTGIAATGYATYLVAPDWRFVLAGLGLGVLQRPGPRSSHSYKGSVLSSRSLSSALLIVVALLESQMPQAAAPGQAMFYIEVPREGQIYVFAIGERYHAFEKSGGVEVGEPIITRSGYGPNGETVVFDSEDAINFYNFKHDLPGEYFPPKSEQKKASFPKGKFSGLMFADYYKYDQWHADQIGPAEPTVEEQEGFWMRRIYLTYDLTFTEKFTTRFRLEANSNGRFAGGNLEPYVKDAYLKWSYKGDHEATLGIHPSLTFDWLEGFWGLRHVEKTPADLYGLDSSRDFGISFSGPLMIDGLEYSAQYGNESGTGSEIDKYKIVRFEGRYERNPGIALEVLYSRAQRPDDEDRTTAQGFAGYRNKILRLGAQYLWQQRDLVAPGPSDQEIDIWSGFVVWDFLPKKADLFARVDLVEGDLDGVETGLPGAATIDYLLLSPDSPFTTWIVGGEWYLLPSIRVGPNFEFVQYHHDPDPVSFPGQDETLLYRLNFFWTF